MKRKFGELAAVAAAGLVVAAPLTAAVLSSSAWAAERGERYYGPHMWGGGWHMVFGPLMMILFVAVIVVLVVLAIRWIGGGHGPAPTGRTPLDILRDRFARGEIDAAEFEERRRVLGE